MIKKNNAVVWSLIVHGVLLIVIIIQVDSGAKRKTSLFKHEIIKDKVVTASLMITSQNESVNNKNRQHKKVIPLKQNNNYLAHTLKHKLSPIPNIDKTAIEDTLSNIPAIKDQPDNDINEITQNEVFVEDIVEPKNKAVDAIQSVSVNNDEAFTSVNTVNNNNTLFISKKYLKLKVSEAPVYNPTNEGAGMSVMNKALPQHTYKYTVKTPEEKRAINVDCTSTTTKVTAMVSGLLGGTIKCQKDHDLSLYIKQKEKPKFKYKLDQ